MIGMIRKYFTSGWELWRFTDGTDDYGGTSKTWSKQSDLEGLMRPLTGDRKLSAYKETDFATHKFYMKPADIQQGDEIRKDNVHYKVKNAPDMMNFGMLMQIELEVVA